MSASLLSKIENDFERLSFDEKILMLEKLIGRLRHSSKSEESAWEKDLAAMAADPEIQKELRAIDTEFRVTEADGLE